MEILTLAAAALEARVREELTNPVLKNAAEVGETGKSPGARDLPAPNPTTPRPIERSNDVARNGIRPRPRLGRGGSGGGMNGDRDSKLDAMG
mgnify:CR=1 FL=1